MLTVSGEQQCSLSEVLDIIVKSMEFNLFLTEPSVSAP